MEYTEEDVTRCDDKEEREYILSISNRFCPDSYQEDWNWYIKCCKYKHIPKHYYGKYTFLGKKRLSEEIFDTESEAVAHITKKTGAAFMIHVGPRSRRTRCYMVNPIKSRRQECRGKDYEGTEKPFLYWNEIKVTIRGVYFIYL